MDIWVPHKEKKKNKTKHQMNGRKRHRRESGEERRFFSFYFLSFLFQIPEFLTVGFRWDKHE